MKIDIGIPWEKLKKLSRLVKNLELGGTNLINTNCFRIKKYI